MHTMHTHGHDQLVIARDAQPLAARDVEDTVMLGPGQRVDAVVVANQQPGTWLVHCHVLDHTEDAMGMPAGLVTDDPLRGHAGQVGAMGTAMMPPHARLLERQPADRSRSGSPRCSARSRG